MYTIFFHNKRCTVGTEGKVQYLPQTFWASFFLMSLLPIWVCGIWIILLFLDREGELLWTAPFLFVFYAVNHRGICDSLRDERIALDRVLRKGKAELLHVQEGQPYLYVTYRKDGVAKTEHFHMDDFRKTGDGWWLMDLKYMELRDLPIVCKNKENRKRSYHVGKKTKKRR